MLSGANIYFAENEVFLRLFPFFRISEQLEPISHSGRVPDAMNVPRGGSRVGCESLMAAKQQKLEPAAAENSHAAADKRSPAIRKGNRSGNSLTFVGSLSVLGFTKPAFSSGRIRSNSTRNYSGAAVSIIPREAMGRGKKEPEEPTSPKVTCIGQVKYKPGRVSSKRPGFDSREVSKCEWRAKLRLSALFRRFLSGRTKGICEAKSQVEEARISEPKGLGKNCVPPLESFKMDDPLPKPVIGIGSSEINLWKRRFVAKPRALDLFNNGARAFGTAKSLTP